MNFKGKVKGDLLLIVVIVIIGLGAFVYNKIAVPKETQAAKVVVEIGGQVVREFDFSQDISQRFDTDDGFNTIEIKDGKVRVSEADCPDLICVNTGWRQYPGQVIVCLPHHFVVKIVGDDESSPELDGFTY